MDPRNLVSMHRRQAQRLGPRPVWRSRRDGLFVDTTWEESREAALAGAAALIDRGIAIGDRVGLLAENRVEWLLADLAILAAGGVNVPLHAPLTAKQIQFQLADAEVRWLIVSSREQLEKVRQIRAEVPGLRGIVVMDRRASAEDAESWDGFLQKGRQRLGLLAQELARREGTLEPDSLASIIYTSGTTGNPKGVMLTHGNLLGNSESVMALSPYRPGDIVLNWLPFSHIYARTIDHYVSLLAGVLVYLADSPETVLHDLEEVQPMRMAAVPRFYEKVLTHIGHADPGKTRRELRRMFGPRVDWLASGGAALPLAVAQRFAEAGFLVLQGYGLTETSPVISFNCKEAYKLETVGRALPGVEVKISEEGEIVTRGAHVMPGYWHNPEATKEALVDGWFHTGDLGTLDGEGYLKITGRKKELIVLSNGKKVVPSFIEGLLTADPCIDQAAVHGEGHNFLTAVIVPHWDNVRHALKADGVHVDGNDVQLADEPAVHALLERRVRERLADVSPSEQVKKFLVLAKGFTIDAEELTVSMKLRRNVVTARHLRRLEALYAEKKDFADD